MFEAKKRGKNRIQIDYNWLDIYKSYVSIHKDGPFFVEKKKFHDVLNDFNKMIIDEMLDHAYSFRAPARMGEFRIQKNNKITFSDKKTMRIDYNASKKLGKIVYFVNKHSDETIYRFYWNKALCNVKNNSIYMFYAIRDAKRRLAKILKQQDREIDYFK